MNRLGVMRSVTLHNESKQIFATSAVTKILHKDNIPVIKKVLKESVLASWVFKLEQHRNVL